jgi:hypothetical protein
VLERAFTPEQKAAWTKSRDALPEELPAQIPMPDGQRPGVKQHVLKKMMPETEKERVTFGQVGILPEWSCHCKAWVEHLGGGLSFESGTRLPEFPPLGSGSFPIGRCK